MALDILIVDDEADIRELVAGVLEDDGYEARCAADSDSALAAIADRRPSLVLLDVWLHGSPMDGLEVPDAIKAREPELPVIIFSGHGNIDTAVSAIGRGAVDFIEKPFEAERLLHLVARSRKQQFVDRFQFHCRMDDASTTRMTHRVAAPAESSSVLMVRHDHGPTAIPQPVCFRAPKFRAWCPRGEPSRTTPPVRC